MNLLRAEGLTKSYGKHSRETRSSFEVNDGRLWDYLAKNPGQTRAPPFSRYQRYPADNGRVIFRMRILPTSPSTSGHGKGMGYLYV